MSSTYGKNIRLSIFGESHGPAVGMVFDGIPAGLPVNLNDLQQFLNRRAPGRLAISTSRHEADKPEFLSGIHNGYTCGTPMAAIIRNTDAKSTDYKLLCDIPRPGHADFTAHIKYNGFADIAGGGHFSGRLTAPLCIAGGLCKQWLSLKGIIIGAHIASIHGIEDVSFNPVAPQISQIRDDFPVIDPERGRKMIDEIAVAKVSGDSVGGIIECAVTGLPIGLGDPIFDNMESRMAQILYSIPAVKGVEFGLGFASAYIKGSQNNDAYTVCDGQIVTQTNHCGGILGGITNGMPLIFRVAIKPTPSIQVPQQSVQLSTMEKETLSIAGRHDPCIVPRAVPAIEAAASIAIFDALLAQETSIWK